MSEETLDITVCQSQRDGTGTDENTGNNEEFSGSEDHTVCSLVEVAEMSSLEKSPSIKLTDKFFINNVTRPGMGFKKNVALGCFVTCILLSLIMIKVYNYKGKSLIPSTKHASYIDALELFHRSSSWNDVRYDQSATISSSDYNSLHNKIMNGVKQNLNEFHENITSELSELKKKINDMEVRLHRLQDDVMFESAAADRGIVIKNLSEREGENVAVTINRLFSEGLGTDVAIDKVQSRTNSGAGSAGVIAVLLEDDNARLKILNARKNLRQHAEYEDVLIESYSSRDSRLAIENFQTLIKILGKEEELILKNGKLLKKAVK